MPTFTPAVVYIGRYNPKGRKFEGKTLVKHDGEWFCLRRPNQRFLDECEYVFLGGHIFEIDGELWAEIVTSVGPECMPTLLTDEDGITGLYPSSFTYPSSSTYTGV